ncbi:MAG: LysM peptidoglycan-binding domain-containing protein [Thermoflexales bacterium]|nr:LysM peptidoglycan-binding domain-containing protein [Thermoflexales bacterium]
MNTKRLVQALAGTMAVAMLSMSTQAPLAGAASAVIRFDPATLALSPGQTGTVNVYIDNVSGLYGVELHLSYNPAIVEVVDANPNTEGVQITAGSFLKADFIAQNQANPSQGTIDFSVLQLPPNAAVSGSGVLATITFRGLTAGSSQLVFTGVNLADANAGAISVTPQSGQVTVGSDGVVPTSTPAPVYPTATPAPVYPTATPVPGYPTATPVPVYPTATPVPGYPTATPALPPTGGGILGYHTVRQQETLFCIGRAYNVLPWSIASQNGVIYPYRLRVGQVLAIPNVLWTNPPYGPVCTRQFGGGSTTAPTPVPPSSGCRATHVVQRGDTLSSLARRYNTTAWSIAIANNILNPNLIFPGQVLCIR